MRFRFLKVIAIVLATLFLVQTLVWAQQVLQIGFEGRDLIFQPGKSDANLSGIKHELTTETAHTGQKSEWIQFIAGNGQFAHYQFTPGQAPVTDELNISLWIKANRPGMQLYCRVVLPKERDPKNLDQPLTLMVKGDIYQLTGRWQQLSLRQPTKRLREQLNLYRAETGKDAVIADAYVDRIVMNLYGGPGQTDVWLDDMEIGPVLEQKASTSPRTPEELPGKTLSRRNSEVQLKNTQLLVSGQKFFLRGVRHTGTPLKVLRDAGFNTVWLDENVANATLDEAVNQGFWIVPMMQLPQTDDQGNIPTQLTSQQVIGKRVSRFLDQEAVLCWDIGSGLSFEKSSLVSRSAQSLRSADPLRPLAADVWDGFQRYSRSVDQIMLGAHRWPLFTTMELSSYRDWINQKRRLAQPGTYTWTWVQTHLPEWYMQNLGVQEGQASIPEPVGPHPEQIRLMTYAAIGAGCKGIGYWSDRFLADSHSGRDRLLALALLNQELQLLEPILVEAEEPNWIDTSVPEVKAAVLRSEKGLLILPIWMGKGVQYVPPQGSSTELTMIIPQAPTGCQAWEISPGQIKSLPWKRVVGGIQISVKEFSLATPIVLTSDLSPNGIVVKWQDSQRKMAKLSAQWSHDLAEEEFSKVIAIHSKLEASGRHLADSQALLKKSRDYIDQSLAHRRNGEYAEAYLDGQRALRPLRILMRTAWESALRDLDNPVATPYSVSYFSLPRHYEFWDQIKHAKLKENVLPDGDFELPQEKVPQGWMVQEVPSLDDVTQVAKRVTDSAHSGKQALMLQIMPKNIALAPVALERSFLAIHSPSIRLEPGTLVRVSGWVKIPGTIKGSADGALMFDSAGGEPLAVRLTNATEWKHFSFYRKVGPSGTIHVTLALTGMGTVYFDDWKIEPMDQGGTRQVQSPAPINVVPTSMGSQSKP